MSTVKVNRRSRIKKRIRKNISGTANKPRLSVFRSNKQIYAQIIDDVSGKTLASAASLHEEKAQKTNKVDQAKIIYSYGIEKISLISIAINNFEIVSNLEKIKSFLIKLKGEI